MGQLVAAYGLSHTALMIRAQAEADAQQVARVLAGFAEVRRRLRDAAVDALLVIGSDHGRTFMLDNMPAFCIGVGRECEGWGEGGVPPYTAKVHQELAGHLLREAHGAGFDLSFSAEMKLDHGFMCPLHFITPEMDIPIVPLFINSTAAPMPSLQRCHDLGAALRQAIGKRPDAERIAIVATGGLSHTVPQLDEFLLRSKRETDPTMEPRKMAKIREFVEQGQGRINEEFDRSILAGLAKGHREELLRMTAAEIGAAGGNGAQEIRNWAALLGAAPDREAEVLVYEPVQKWLTGIALVSFNL